MSVDSEEDLTRQLAKMVVIEVCPEEEPFFEFIDGSSVNRKKKESELAFGVEAGGAVLSVIILDAVRSALAEAWEIVKPTLRQAVSEGAEKLKDTFFNKISNYVNGKDDDPGTMFDQRDIDRIIQAAKRSAARNGCSEEQIRKIADSLRRSLRAKRG